MSLPLLFKTIMSNVKNGKSSPILSLQVFLSFQFSTDADEGDHWVAQSTGDRLSASCQVVSGSHLSQ